MIFTTPPCRDCAERYIGCHADCLMWSRWKTSEDKRKEEINQAKKLDADCWSAQQKKNIHFQRRMHRSILRGRPIW